MPRVRTQCHIQLRLQLSMEINAVKVCELVVQMIVMECTTNYWAQGKAHSQHIWMEQDK